MVEMTGLDKASLVSFSSISPFCFAKDGLCRFKLCRKFKELKIDTTKIYSKKLTITTRNRVVAKQSSCEENMIVGNYFFIFYDMPHFVWRDIFAFAKVIL